VVSLTTHQAAVARALVISQLLRACAFLFKLSAVARACSLLKNEEKEESVQSVQSVYFQVTIEF
jgi:hypothetical protein